MHTRPWKIFYGITLATGMLMLAGVICLYNRTFIHAAIPVFLTLAAGSLACLLNRHHYHRTFHTRRIFFPFIHNVLSWGCAACCVFMALNYYFAHGTAQPYTLPVQSAATLPDPDSYRKEPQPTVFINYAGHSKRLILEPLNGSTAAQASHVKLYVKRGLLGFDVIERYEAVTP